MVTYSKSDEFYEEIPIGSLSATTRWRYARALEVKDRAPGSARTQEERQALLESTKEAIGGENAICEFLINRDGSDAITGLALYSSLMRAALYISEKNDDVSSLVTFWVLVTNA